MSGSGGKGTLYNLAHQKTNALSAIKSLSEEMVSRLAHAGENDEQFYGALSLLEARSKQMETVDQLDRRMDFLRDSGYVLQKGEAERIALERGTIFALIGSIQALDRQGIETLEKARERLMESMKEIKDGQRSLKAYTPLPEEEEGRQVDTLR